MSGQFQKYKFAGVAQSAEQLTCNQQVEGSSPFASSIFLTSKLNLQTYNKCKKEKG